MDTLGLLYTRKGNPNFPSLGSGSDLQNGRWSIGLLVRQLESPLTLQPGRMSEVKKSRCLSFSKS